MSETADALPLIGHVKTYDWGSTELIQRFIGLPEGRSSIAELWFGAHPSGPTLVSTSAPGRPSTSLEQAIRHDPDGLLGRDIARRFGARLPYLLKLLAPGRAVSLQVHPGRDYAEEGHERELQQQIPPSERRFADSNHKPEMILAIETFEGLVGFRTTAVARTILEEFDHPAMSTAAHRLSDEGSDARASVFATLAALDSATTGELISSARLLARNRGARETEFSDPVGTAIRTAVDLAEQYPGDAGAVAALLLERVRLAPGEAVFVPAGTPHSYLNGLAVEIMAGSDNVFRAGLTTKRVDLEAVTANLRLDAPTVFAASQQTTPCEILRPDAEEFALAVVDVAADQAVSFEPRGPRIVLAVEGRVALSTDRSAEAGRAPLTLERGHAAFVPDRAGALTTTGPGRAVIAFVAT